MALMTVCPACSTRFKVVQDQLRLHHGLVRCGACSHVFDANTRLESLPEEAPADTQPSDEIRPQDWINKPAVVALTTPQAKSNGVKNESWSELLLPIGAKTQAAKDARELTQSVHYVGTQPPSVRASVEKEAKDVKAAKRREPPKVQTSDSSRRQTTLDLHHESDSSDAPSSAGLKKTKKVNAVLAVLCILALLAIIAQLMVVGRFMMADKAPELKPILTQLCEPLHCTVEPATWLAPLTLDALSLSKLSAATSAEMQPYRVQATVRNSSQLSIKTPHIELTVSNAQGSTIARKTLTPAQLGGAKALAPNSDWVIDSVLLMDQQTVGYTARLVYLP
jgi:predicted Zn finger-like uncharacterized protein